MKEFFELIEKRESCREFDITKLVEHDKLIACIKAARLAPSACNSQPWHYTVVSNPDLCQKLRPALQDMRMNAFVKDCPVFIVVSEVDAGPMATVGGRIKDQHYALIDIGLSVSQLCLAATTQGLSTCILGWFDEKALKRLCKLPQIRRVRLVICIGYARTDAHRKKLRKDLDEIAAFWN